MAAFIARRVQLQHSPLRRAAIAALPRSRCYATEASGAIRTLLFLEHREGKLNPGSLNALTAAAALGGDIVGLVTGDGEGPTKAAEAAKKCVVVLLVVAFGLGAG